MFLVLKVGCLLGLSECLVFSLTNKKTNVLGSYTNIGLLLLPTKFLSCVLGLSVFHVSFSILRAFCELYFLLKSVHTTIFSVSFFNTLPKFLCCHLVCKDKLWLVPCTSAPLFVVIWKLS